MNPGHTEWSLSAGHDPGWLVTLVVIGVVGLALWEIVSALRAVDPARRRRHAAIAALRVLAIALLAAMSFELTLRIDERAPTRRRVVVLVDDSASMAIADAREAEESPQARWERLEEVWARSNAVFDSWRAAGYVVETMSFGEDTSAFAELGELEPAAADSDLAGALAGLAEAEHPPAALVVVSDGLVGAEASDQARLDALADQLGAPVTTLAVGAPHLEDMAIARLRVGEFAFVENRTDFAAEVVAHGLAGQSADARLLRDGVEVARKRLTLGGDGEPTTLEFTVTPERVGQSHYAIELQPLDGEATLENNRRTFVVDVLRDKVRILHVAGRPDWDVRALRTLLRRDPNVELLSYYILRDWDDVDRDDGQAPMSLIAFPTEEIFGTELHTFDLVIMQNFDATRHGDYLGNIARFVQEGGALVVIGGDLGLAEGHYLDQRLAPLLPFAPANAPLIHAKVRPQLSEAGRRHPVSAWLAEKDPAGWADLPAFESVNEATQTSQPEVGALALLVDPERSGSDGRPAPLLSVSQPGEGRVLMLATGETWRLGFAADLPLVDGSRPYDLMWLSAVRWLLHDGSADRLVLELDEDAYALDQSVQMRVKTLGPSYGPEGEVDVVWEARRVDTEAAQAARRGELNTDGEGRSLETLEPFEAGAWAIQAWRDDDPDQFVRRVFVVGDRAQELASLDADAGAARLRALSERSDGLALVLHEGDELPVDLPSAEVDADEHAPLARRREVPLWTGWLALVVLCAVFPLEWWLRRRDGLR